MKRAERRQNGKSALDVIEEAVHLLRTSPAGTLAAYYVGTLPFVLGLLYFWMDMARSAYGESHLAAGALGMALLFLWMKVWQTIFARNLRASLSGGTPFPFSFSRCWRVFVTQAALQWTGLFLLPLALILVIPFAWVYAFYQSLTVLDDGESCTLREFMGKVRRQAALWPGQNLALLAFLAGFGLYIFLNWCTVCFAIPESIRLGFGVESVFSRSPMSMFNSTFFAAMFSLTYLCVDPIVKTAYTLRCFYGDSLKSGEDLKAELQQSTLAAAQFAACLIASLVLMWTTPGASASVPCPGGTSENSPMLQHWVRAYSGMSPVGTAERVTFQPSLWDSGLPGRDRNGPIILATHSVGTPTLEEENARATLPHSSSPPGTPAISPAELDQTIQRVIQQDKYAWRAPREKLAKPDAKDQGVIGRFLDGVLDLIKGWGKSFFDWLGRWLDRLFRGRASPAPAPSEIDWMLWLRLVMYLLIAVVALALALFIFQAWSRRYRQPEAVVSEPIQSVPDLTDENVGADQLPEDGWIKLARKLRERGELRLALRAFYLASLAHLAWRNLITLAKFKSNHDYAVELSRRGHSFPDLQALFGENVSVFDRIWYGLHDLDSDLLARFAANVERIKTGGAG